MPVSLKRLFVLIPVLTFLIFGLTESSLPAIQLLPHQPDCSWPDPLKEANRWVVNDPKDPQWGISVTPNLLGCEFGYYDVYTWDNKNPGNSAGQVQGTLLLWQSPIGGYYVSSLIQPLFGDGMMFMKAREEWGNAVFYFASYAPYTDILRAEYDEANHVAITHIGVDNAPADIQQMYHEPERCGLPSRFEIMAHFMKTWAYPTHSNNLKISAMSQSGSWEIIGDCAAAYTNVWVSNPALNADPEEAFSVTYFMYQSQPGTWIESFPYKDELGAIRYSISAKVTADGLALDDYFMNGEVHHVTFSEADREVKVTTHYQWSNLLLNASSMDMYLTQQGTNEGFPFSYAEVVAVAPMPSVQIIDPAVDPKAWDRSQIRSNFSFDGWKCMGGPDCPIQRLTIYGTTGEPTDRDFKWIVFAFHDPADPENWKLSDFTELPGAPIYGEGLIAQRNQSYTYANCYMGVSEDQTPYNLFLINLDGSVDYTTGTGDCPVIPSEVQPAETPVG